MANRISATASADERRRRRRGEKAKNYGTPTEKRERQKRDGEHRHGGRDAWPDPDVNPAERLHIDEDELSPPPPASIEEPFASRLPDRAFEQGDLFRED